MVVNDSLKGLNAAEGMFWSFLLLLFQEPLNEELRQLLRRINKMMDDIKSDVSFRLYSIFYHFKSLYPMMIAVIFLGE